MIRAGGYRRVSTVEQADSGRGLAAQQTIIEAEAAGAAGSWSRSTPMRLPRASQLWVA